MITTADKSLIASALVHKHILTTNTLNTYTNEHTYIHIFHQMRGNMLMNTQHTKTYANVVHTVFQEPKPAPRCGSYATHAYACINGCTNIVTSLNT